MNALEKFDFNGSNVRVVMKDDEPWFVAADVCAVLTLRDVSSALKMVDDEDRQSFSRSEGPQFGSTFDPRVHTVNVVNESGLYSMIFQSNKPQAKEFKRWVTSVVLPTIRKTGGYVQPGVDLTDPAQLLAIMKASTEALEKSQKRVAELEPKGEAFDQLMEADGCYSMATAAQMIGLGQNTLFRKLREDKILIDSGVRHNTPYQAYMDLFEVITRPSGGPSNKVTLTTRVKPAGIEWLRKRYSTQLV